MDAHLGRWERALAHLLAAGPAHHSTALALARERGLLRQLLALCQEAEGAAAPPPQQQQQQQDGAEQQRALGALRLRAMEAYAESLEGRNLPEDAALAFLAAGQADRAVAAYLAAGEWRMALALAGRAGWGPARVRQLAEQAVAELQHLARPAEAAAVAERYLGDVDSAVALLSGAGEWREALRAAHAAGRPDLVDTLVAPAAAAAAAAALEEAQEGLGRVRKYWARLRELRGRRLALSAAVEAEGGGGGGPADDDLASQAASQLSGLSIYTDASRSLAPSTWGASSVASTVGGRRKGGRPRKAKSGTKVRAGSPQEERQLAEHLLGLAPTGQACSQAGQLAELLVLLGHERDAAVLQRALAALAAEQAAAAADVLAHPPPGAGLALPRSVGEGLAARVGAQAAAAAAVELAASLPSQDLVAKAAAAEAGMKEARWKWDLLRAP